MKLSQKVIDAILKSGFYFEDEFDFDKNEVVLTEQSKQWFKDNLGVEHLDSAFVEFYSFAIGGMGQGEELYNLEQIMDDLKQQNWLNLFDDEMTIRIKAKYPDAGKRYLQFTSIEGQGSYFYDVQTDYVYDVNWGEEEAMITGELKPWFKSFYDFLEWYYDVDSEE